MKPIGTKISPKDDIIGCSASDGNGCTASLGLDVGPASGISYNADISACEKSELSENGSGTHERDRSRSRSRDRPFRYYDTADDHAAIVQPDYPPIGVIQEFSCQITMQFRQEGRHNRVVQMQIDSSTPIDALTRHARSVFEIPEEVGEMTGEIIVMSCCE